MSSTVWIISGGHISDSITALSSEKGQLVKCTIDQAWSEPLLLASMCMISLEKVSKVCLADW